MKFGFVTCVQLGLSCIEKIYDIGGKLDLLITIPDHKAKNKSGRIYLDDFSKEHNISLVKANHINDNEVIEAIKQHDLDWLFIIGWSQIASKEVLVAPKKGCLGIHPTLLPTGRGRAAIPWAIIKGLDKTGITLFKLDEGVDTGVILGQIEIPLPPEETATELYHKINKAHEILIVDIFPKLESNMYQIEIQDENKATLWEGRTPADGELNLGMTLNEADRLIRATTHPYPGAFIILNGIKRIIWKGEKILSLSDTFPPNLLKFKDGYYLPLDFEDIKN